MQTLVLYHGNPAHGHDCLQGFWLLRDKLQHGLDSRWLCKANNEFIASASEFTLARYV